MNRLLMNLNPDRAKKIKLCSTINLAISVIYTLKLCLKLGNYSHYSKLQNYGYIYLFIDFLSGPCAIAVEMYYYVVHGRYTYHGDFLRFLKIFTLPRVRTLILEILYILPKCYGLLFSIFLIYYVFTFISKILFQKHFPQFFGSMSDAMLTMFQVLTLDSWGSMIVRPIARSEGHYAVFFFTIYIILMGYVFLNIFLGILVAYYANKQVRSDFRSHFLEVQKPDKGKKTMKDLLQTLQLLNKDLGKFHYLEQFDKLILFYWFITLLNNYLYNYVEKLTYIWRYVKTTEILFGILFSVHAAYLFYVSESIVISFFGKIKIRVPKHLKDFHALIDLVSGPVALIFDIYDMHYHGYLETGPVLRILKLMNTAHNKMIFKKLLDIMPAVYPAFLLILGIVYYYAFYATLYLKYAENSGVFSSLGDSYLTLIQIMTLDAWAGIARITFKEHPYAAFFFVSFIVIVTLVLVNLSLGLIAIASSELSDKIFERSINERELITKDEYEDFLEEFENAERKITSSASNSKETNQDRCLKKIMDLSNHNNGRLTITFRGKKFVSGVNKLIVSQIIV
eukprot:TRINITY_DN5233_c0_g1_i4.p1 TRINITY_DN5233_c0_g1~~TRINITY_DN5233_c0_g1_i4.p1  ORF type:complete len:566 (+),score=77.74 TRINITY_DN5233_c0_g1_i4:179-1876(+)